MAVTQILSRILIPKLQLFIQTAGIDTLKTFRKQQELLDAMLQSVKIYCINLCAPDCNMACSKVLP